MRTAPLVVALVIASGCGFSAPAASDATGDAGIDAAVDLPDGALPPDASIDTDRDGTPDDEDDCPTIADALQADHDHDGPGDACDPCPHLPNQNLDGDGDGVGDACDPHPTQPIDTRVWFDGFTDPTTLAHYDTLGEPWTVVSGRLVTGDVGGYSTLVPTGLVVTDATQTIGYAVTAVGVPDGMGNAPQVSTIESITPIGTTDVTQVACGLGRSAANQTFVGAYQHYQGAPNTGPQVWAVPLAGEFVAQETLSSVQGVRALRCDFHSTDPTTPTTVVTSSVGSNAPDTGGVGVFRFRVAVAIDYWFIVGTRL